jgi:hypothetical protein
MDNEVMLESRVDGSTQEELTRKRSEHTTHQITVLSLLDDIRFTYRFLSQQRVERFMPTMTVEPTSPPINI